MRENVLCARGSAVVQWNSGHVWIIYPFAGEGVPGGRFLPAITRAQLMRTTFQEWVGLCVCVCGYLKNWLKKSCTPRGVPHSEWICLEIGARSVGCVCRVPGQNGHLKSLFSTIYWTLTTPSRQAPPCAGRGCWKDYSWIPVEHLFDGEFARVNWFPSIGCKVTISCTEEFSFRPSIDNGRSRAGRNCMITTEIAVFFIRKRFFIWHVIYNMEIKSTTNRSFE